MGGGFVRTGLPFCTSWNASVQALIALILSSDRPFKGVYIPAAKDRFSEFGSINGLANLKKQSAS